MGEAEREREREGGLMSGEGKLANFVVFADAKCPSLFENIN